MDYSVLKTEIDLPAYSGMTDQQIMNALNDKTIAAYIDVDPLDIEAYLMLYDLWIPIKEGTSLASKKTVEAFRLFKPLSFSDPVKRVKIIQILDGLVTDVTTPDFTSTHKDFILAMADSFISRADELGLPDVDLTDIQNAKEYV